MDVTFVKNEKQDSREQTVLKIKTINCSGTELDLFKRYFSLLEYFQLYHVHTGENAENETNHFTYAQATSANTDLSEG